MERSAIATTSSFFRSGENAMVTTPLPIRCATEYRFLVTMNAVTLPVESAAARREPESLKTDVVSFRGLASELLALLSERTVEMCPLFAMDGFWFQMRPRGPTRSTREAAIALKGKRPSLGVKEGEGQMCQHDEEALALPPLFAFSRSALAYSNTVSVRATSRRFSKDACQTSHTLEDAARVGEEWAHLSMERYGPHANTLQPVHTNKRPLYTSPFRRVELRSLRTYFEK